MAGLKFAAIYKCETQGNQNTPIADRKRELEAAVGDAYEAIRSSGKQLGMDLAVPSWGLFAAPEYTFCFPAGGYDHDFGESRHLDEGDKIQIESWIRQLSVRYPKLVLFPGSVAWRKSFDRGTVHEYLTRKGMPTSGDDLKKLSWQEQMALQHKKLKFSRKKTRAEKATVAIGRHADTFLGGQRDLGVAGPKTWNRTYTSITVDAPTNQQKLDDIAAGAGKMARNTCYVYWNGKRVLKYNKQQDFHEVLEFGGDTVYVPGVYDPVVTVDGVTYGMEICLDHAYGTFRTVASATPDVFVLLSASVDLEWSNVSVRANGWVFHACSIPAQCGAWKKGAYDPRESRRALRSDLDLYSFLI